MVDSATLPTIETAARWVLVVAIFSLLVYQERHRLAWHSVGRELVVVVSAYFLYFGVRGLTEGGIGNAFDNGWHVISLEQRLGVFHEVKLQSHVVDHRWAVNALNWVYIYGHWPVIVVTGVWLYLYHPVRYQHTRDAMLISGAVGLVVFVLFPVAPPRLMDIGIVDTVTLHSHAYRVLQPPQLTNQYAAMPSLHFGWNLLMGLMLARSAGVLAARIFGVVLPMAMVVAVVLTGNHFIIDVVAGGGLSLAALWLVWWLNRPKGAQTATSATTDAEPEVTG